MTPRLDPAKRCHAFEPRQRRKFPSQQATGEGAAAAACLFPAQPHTALFLQICFTGILFKNTSTKCSPGKVFGIKPPFKPLDFRGLDTRLCQHYISPKMICCNFSNFCRKKIPGLTSGGLIWSLYF